MFCAALLIAPPQLPTPRHSTVQPDVAVQSILPVHVPGDSQTTVQLEPPQVIAPHVLLPPQAIEQVLASAQSMPPLHAF